MPEIIGKPQVGKTQAVRPRPPQYQPPAEEMEQEAMESLGQMQDNSTHYEPQEVEFETVVEEHDGIPQQPRYKLHPVKRNSRPQLPAEDEEDYDEEDYDEDEEYIEPVRKSQPARRQPTVHQRLAAQSKNRAERRKAKSSNVNRKNPTRSIFRDDENYYSETVDLDGFKFNIKELSEEIFTYVLETPSRVKEASGLNKEEFEGLSDEQIQEGNLGDEIDAQTALETFAVIEDMYDAVLADALVSWNAPRECTDENKALLSMKMKGILAKRIIKISNFTDQEDEFFRAGDKAGQ